MIKKLTLLIVAVLSSAVLFAQDFTGGVKGTVVSREGRTPIENAKIVLYQGTAELVVATSDPSGNFLIPNLDNGMYTLVISAPDFLDTQVQVTVNDGYVKNMFNLSMTPTRTLAEIEDESLMEFDMDDSGYNDNPTVLFGSNDIFTNIAGYNFSSVRFRQRGYLGESQDVYLAGVKMNDAITGYSPFSLWSGLNEAMRSKDTTIGNEVSDYGLGGYNGVTNIFGNASSVRKGLRGSVLTNSSLYRLRLMASYATGEMDNGWSFAGNISARLGGNDWIQGVYYRSFAYYLAADKKFNDAHKIGVVFFATPGQRGAQNASTQEVYDLVGDNMYNSNWGYQAGKVRNSRVRKTNEPIAILKYNFTPSDKFQAAATLLYRFGKNGYTALDWYDSADPRPDYYRNLPSYFLSDNDDLNRSNLAKSAWAKEAWTHAKAYPDIVHVNWDRLYNVNTNNTMKYAGRTGNRSKYVQEERHVDQRDLNLAGNFKWRASEKMILTGGFDGKVNRTEYYKIIADLLGGDYYINIDNFADRDYSATPAKVQNDVDYYKQYGAAKVLGVGDKYGYDYYAQVRDASLWLNGKYSLGSFSANLGGRVGYNVFWREGLMRKGLFAGLNPDGSHYVVDGVDLTTFDHKGNVVTSYGKSEKAGFLTYALKGGLNYVIGGNQRVYANVGWFNDAPKFGMAFLSPRTRNSLMDGLTTIKTLSSDINWQFTGSGYNARVTLYYTRIMDQTKLMSAYDDLQNAFSNFALTGIDEQHYGVELGVKVPTPVPNLSLQGALSAGRYEYISTPKMTQTIDNSSELIYENALVAFWKGTPVFKRNADGSFPMYEGTEEYTFEIDHWQKHYVPSTPQLAASLGLSYNYNYWFIDADVQYFGESYLDMNPLYRTDYAVAGPDYTMTPSEVEYMTAQEKFDPAFLLNFSVGKSWYIQRKYQLGFSLNARNLLNNTSVKTGGYEQTRIVDNTVNKERYYRFDPKYFYMSGFNYMLNIYFRF